MDSCRHIICNVANIASCQEVVVTRLLLSSDNGQGRSGQGEKRGSALAVFAAVMQLVIALVYLITSPKRSSLPEWAFWTIVSGTIAVIVYQVILYRDVLWIALRTTLPQQIRRPIFLVMAGFSVAIAIGLYVINSFGGSQPSDVKQAANSLIQAASFLAAASVALVAFFAGKFLDLITSSHATNRDSVLANISELNLYGSASLVLFVGSAFFAVITVISGFVSALGMAFALITLGVIFLIIGWQRAQLGIRQVLR